VGEVKISPEHAESDKTAMKRLVPAAASGDHRNLAVGSVGPKNRFDGRMELHEITMGSLESRQGFDNNVIHLVNEFLHVVRPPFISFG